MTKMVLGVASASSCDASFRIWCLGVRSFSSCFPPLHSFTFCIVDSVRYLAGSYISVCSSIISVILRPPILVSSFIFFCCFHVLHITLANDSYHNASERLHARLTLFSLFSSIILYFGLYHPVNTPTDFIFFITITICFAFKLHITRIRAWTIHCPIP